jgi:hypothetical protein
MTQLKWLEDPEGLVSGDYRIWRVGESPRYRWRLKIGGQEMD